MKRKLLATLLATTMATSLMVGATAFAADDISVILITMDSTDQHWVSVDGGAQKAAEELGISERTLYRKLPAEFRTPKKTE